MSDTPRTDAILGNAFKDHRTQFVGLLPNFARQLERENNRLRAKLEFLYGRFSGCKWADCGPLEHNRPEDEKYVTRDSWEMMLEKWTND